MIQVFLVDDNSFMRKTMKQLIELEDDLRVCGEASSIEEAVRGVVQAKPDIALIDISLGGNEQGIELIREIRLQGQSFPILTVSLHEEALYAGRVMEAGAQGYLMKQDAPESIVKVIRVLVGGGKNFPLLDLKASC